MTRWRCFIERWFWDLFEPSHRKHVCDYCAPKKLVTLAEYAEKCGIKLNRLPSFEEYMKKKHDLEKEKCECNHLRGQHGDSAHGFAKGHGECQVPRCTCGKFTWASNSDDV